MGETGPCGPCTEIHYDRIGNRDAAHLVNMDDPDVIEIWNLVFIQFNREENGSLTPLPSKHVDTGMGFERITSVLQNKRSNYDTDIFDAIFKAIQQRSGARPYTGHIGKEDTDGVDTAYRVLADHIRTLVVAISDGGMPDVAGRGYVLRRIIRRAVRFASDFLYTDSKPGFFSELVDVVVEQLGDVFPEIKNDPSWVKQVILSEELQFAKTLGKGKQLFLSVAESKDTKESGVIKGETAFELYDTHGFPLDLTQLMAEERGLVIDIEGFERAKQKAIEISKNKGAKSSDVIALGAEQTDYLNNKINVSPTDDFHKYTWQPLRGATIKAIYSTEKGFVNEYDESEKPVGIILDKSNFYAEGGGQVADHGLVTKESDTGVEFHVTNVQSYAGFVVHMGTLSEGAKFCVGDSVVLSPDFVQRMPTAANHTSTHILNFALREVFGDRIEQRGSIVEPDKLRFDFLYHGSPKVDEVIHVERIVQDVIKRDLPVYNQAIPLSKARMVNGLRVMAGETYPDPVRVVSIGQPVDDLLANPESEEWRAYSTEFCGGTHLQRTGEAQEFAIISEGSIAKGIRRIVAYTRNKAREAHETADDYQRRLTACRQLPMDQRADVFNKLRSEFDNLIIPLSRRELLSKQNNETFEEIKVWKKELAKKLMAKATELAEKVSEDVTQNNSKFVVQFLDSQEFPADQRNAMATFIATFKGKHSNVPVMTISIDTDKNRVSLLAEVPKSISATLHAAEWSKSALNVCNGKGGGNANKGQGQGTEVENVQAALNAAKEFAASKLV